MFWLFIGDVLSVGKTVLSAGEEIFGGGGGLSVDEYYPAVKAGALTCPGPFSIAEVATALDNNPEFVPRIDAILATDRAWAGPPYGPLTTNAQKASAIVNWAHGGRDCEIKGTEATYGPIIRQLLATEAERQRKAAQTAPSAAVEAVTDTLQAQGVSPLQLGLGAVTLLLLFRGGS